METKNIWDVYNRCGQTLEAYSTHQNKQNGFNKHESKSHQFLSGFFNKTLSLQHMFNMPYVQFNIHSGMFSHRSISHIERSLAFNLSLSNNFQFVVSTHLTKQLVYCTLYFYTLA